MRTRFICSMDNVADVKVLFKPKDDDDELTFTKAIRIALKTEEAARVVKEMIYTGKHLSQFTRWGSQKARPVHLEFLHTGPRTNFRGSWTSHFQGILWQV